MQLKNNLSTRCNGVVIGESASQSVDLRCLLKKMVFTFSLLGAQHKRDIVENKPASLLVMSLDKALNGMPPSLCGRQVAGPSSLPNSLVAQSN